PSVSPDLLSLHDALPIFLDAMLARLTSHELRGDDGTARRPLAALRTRRRDDPAIALLDAWATVGDVLTFYSERIANEGFLRTARSEEHTSELQSPDHLVC